MKIMKPNKTKKIVPIFMLAVFLSFGFLGVGIVKVNAADTGTTVNFDVLPGQNPKIMPGDNKVPIVLTVTMDIGKYITFCGDPNLTTFHWSIYEHPPLTVSPTDVGWNVTSLQTETFDRNSPTITKTINTTVTAITTGQGGAKVDPINFYALIECSTIITVAGVPTGVHQNVAQSAPYVPVIVGSGALISTCIVPNGSGYVFACSKANLSNCSDTVPKCGDSCNSPQIHVSLCGSPAPNPNPSGGTGTCGGAGQLPCSVPAGKDQTYSFNITNPLAGGPSNPFDIINIVTQWIMYISIPLAVLFIMYAGFLMLTAGPVPANFQKGRDILKYTVLGLAIIFIGKGFVSLIISIIELGGTGNSPPTTQTQALPGAGTSGTGSTYVGPHICNNGVCANGMVGPCQVDSDCVSSDKTPLQYQNTLTVSQGATSGGIVNSPYDISLFVSNPINGATYNWAIVGGALPPGTNLVSATDANGGGISGTPTKTGTYNVTIQAMDIPDKLYGRVQLKLIIQ